MGLLTCQESPGRKNVNRGGLFFFWNHFFQLWVHPDRQCVTVVVELLLADGEKPALGD